MAKTKSLSLISFLATLKTYKLRARINRTTLQFCQAQIWRISPAKALNQDQRMAGKEPSESSIFKCANVSREKTFHCLSTMIGKTILSVWRLFLNAFIPKPRTKACCSLLYIREGR